jgi:heme/copper-type cytochrome/quinol oxidase subunit 1
MGFSIERLIIVYFPFIKYSTLKEKVKQLCVWFIMILSLCIYSFSLFMTGLEELNSNIMQCVPLEKWIIPVKKIVLVDILITILIPFMVIFLANLFISFKLMKGSISKNKNRLSESRNSAKNRYISNFGSSSQRNSTETIW